MGLFALTWICEDSWDWYFKSVTHLVHPVRPDVGSRCQNQVYKSPRDATLLYPSINVGVIWFVCRGYLFSDDLHEVFHSVSFFYKSGGVQPLSICEDSC